MTILDGKKLSQKILADLKEQVSQMKKKPVLAIVSVGDDESSKVYIKNKRIACDSAGIEAHEFCFPDESKEQEVLGCIQELNNDPDISAIIVQLPLPAQMDRYQIFSAISPEKDADCLNPLNFGNFFQKGEANFPIGPATPVGIIKLFEEYGINLSKKDAVLVGYSDIVGKPLSEMLLSREATVTICHDKTHNLGSFTRRADIVVSATGVKHLIKRDMVKKGAIVVDVGIFREGKKITGDVDFDNVAPKASYITPVPGGIGPMTVAALLINVLRLFNLQQPRSNEDEARPKKKSGIATLEIEMEFKRYVSLVEDQLGIISSLRQSVARNEAGLKMIKFESDKIKNDLSEALTKILSLRPTSFGSPKEKFAKQARAITDQLRSRIKKLRRNIDDFGASLAYNESETFRKIKNFRIPKNYGDYYNECKNFFENEIKINDQKIHELEECEKEINSKIAESTKFMEEVTRLLLEWDNWINERSKDIYEDMEDFYLAATNHFEHQREVSKEIKFGEME